MKRAPTKLPVGNVIKPRPHFPFEVQVILASSDLVSKLTERGFDGVTGTFEEEIARRKAEVDKCVEQAVRSFGIVKTRHEAEPRDEELKEHYEVAKVNVEDITGGVEEFLKEMCRREKLCGEEMRQRNKLR